MAAKKKKTKDAAAYELLPDIFTDGDGETTLASRVADLAAIDAEIKKFKKAVIDPFEKAKKALVAEVTEGLGDYEDATVIGTDGTMLNVSPCSKARKVTDKKGALAAIKATGADPYAFLEIPLAKLDAALSDAEADKYVTTEPGSRRATFGKA